MADVKSDVVLEGSRPNGDVPAGVTLTKVASYTIPASGGPGDGDLVEMVCVPKGAKIVEVVVSSSDVTASMTIDVGDAGDADRYLDGVTASAVFVSRL